MDDVSDIKRISSVQLRLLGFKSMSCLQPYHNLRPSTFIYPDEVVIFLGFNDSYVWIQFMIGLLMLFESNDQSFLGE